MFSKLHREESRTLGVVRSSTYTAPSSAKSTSASLQHMEARGAEYGAGAAVSHGQQRAAIWRDFSGAERWATERQGGLGVGFGPTCIASLEPFAHTQACGHAQTRAWDASKRQRAGAYNLPHTTSGSCRSAASDAPPALGRAELGSTRYYLPPAQPQPTV